MDDIARRLRVSGGLVARGHSVPFESVRTNGFRKVASVSALGKFNASRLKH